MVCHDFSMGATTTVVRTRELISRPSLSVMRTKPVHHLQEAGEGE
jgi:hypothetical protein